MIRAGLALRWAAAVYLAALAALATLAFAPIVTGWRGNLIVSGSMAPSLPPGSVLMTSAASGDEVEPGDVLVVRDPSAPEGAVAHRLVRRTADGRLVLRGDANPSEDAVPRAPSDVLGVARYEVPLIGLPLLWLRERAFLPLAGWLLVTTAALALVTARRDRDRTRPDGPAGATARSAAGPA